MYDPQRTSGDSLPLWYADQETDIPYRDFPDGPVDVAVIGAGITGLSTAYHLLAAGRRVVIIDKGKVGSGETGRTTAHLASGLDDRYFSLERMHGASGAQQAAESHAAAIASIGSIAEREGIDCGFKRVDGWLFAASARDRGQIERERAAAERAGLIVSVEDRAPVPFATGPVLRFRDQAQFHPLHYVRGLARAVRAQGGLLITDARVTSVEEGKPARIQLDGGTVITAKVVVVATNSPIVDVFAMHTKQAAYRSYVLAVAIPKGSVPPGLYWDTADPYHYVRVAGDDDLLIVGGEDHKVGQSKEPERSWARLEEWTRTRFPSAGEVRQRWSGQIWEPADGLAFIGRNPGRADNVFIATGDSGNGLTHGALAGMLLADAIAGRHNPWAALYDPSRKILGPQATREFVKENLNVALQYGAWLKPSAQSDRIRPGEGAVIRRGLAPVALYVDDAGTQHACSAVCPHLGGVVAWNRAEQSWDCPCHGSRFDPYGRVLTGPAKRDLTPLAVESDRPKEEDSAVHAHPPASAE